MTKVYRKTATIKAEQFDGSNEMIDKYHIRCDIGFLVFGDPVKYKTFPYQLETQYGWGNISIGDWIATNDDGKYILITDDFKKTHAELPVIPKTWADTIEELKANHYKLSEFFNEWKCNYDEQELIARAWLDGYTVEE
ncbi:DUF1642 domain-containing protein [Pediococcus acidilactici]|uniref:DUF1642 domain-containing protein n=1 Tax=Pediococcus acidilactici TaxID=1254 RepID=UPI00132F950B|nr:DUF1642 domain-containing protein [Pediococcus acidilactici]KAF0439766.1 DUF1642 domain-containing protein [Pediococcus acidilactici]